MDFLVWNSANVKLRAITNMRQNARIHLVVISSSRNYAFSERMGNKINAENVQHSSPHQQKNKENTTAMRTKYRQNRDMLVCTKLTAERVIKTPDWKPISTRKKVNKRWQEARLKNASAQCTYMHVYNHRTMKTWKHQARRKQFDIGPANPFPSLYSLPPPRSRPPQIQPGGSEGAP